MRWIDMCPSRSNPYDDQPGDFEHSEHAQQLILSMHSKCCDGWKNDNRVWFFHAKGWEFSNDTVSVEAGVELDAHGATTYWIYDDDSLTCSHEYGEEILYPDDLDDGEAWSIWHEEVMAQLEDAPRWADDCDIATCEQCGYHHHLESPCCEEASD